MCQAHVIKSKKENDTKGNMIEQHADAEVNKETDVCFWARKHVQ